MDKEIYLPFYVKPCLKFQSLAIKVEQIIFLNLKFDKFCLIILNFKKINYSLTFKK